MPSASGDPDIEPIAEGVPATPSGLSVTARDGDVGIVLTWNPNLPADSVVRFNVFYSGTSDGTYQFIGSTDKNRFEYISFPSEGWYKITASNNIGESAPTAAVEMKTQSAE